jgi:hypothetical protein
MAEQKVKQKGPYILDVEAGSHLWCACGQSIKNKINAYDKQPIVYPSGQRIASNPAKPF